MVSDFQKNVYSLLKKVPKGKITTYKEISMAMKCRAYRAVGSALNKNPYSPDVACHRVVNSNGSVGGFAKGIKKKISLLKKEGVEIKNNRIIDFKKRLFGF